MTKDQFHELIMGAVLIAAGYALYVHFKKPPVPVTGAQQPVTPAAQQPMGIQSLPQVQAPVAPNVAQQPTTLKQLGLNTAQKLIDGAVNDWVGIGGSDGQSWF